MNRPTVTAYPDRLKPCPSCGVWFHPLRKSAVYCSNACRQKAFRDQGLAYLLTSKLGKPKP